MKNVEVKNESKETFGIINSFDEWKSIISKKEQPNSEYDFDNAKLLVEKCNINYFMESPVVVFEGKSILAFSRQYFSIEEIVEEFNKINNHSKVFLYMLFTRIFPSDKSWIVRYDVLSDYDNG